VVRVCHHCAVIATGYLTRWYESCSHARYRYRVAATTALLASSAVTLPSPRFATRSWRSIACKCKSTALAHSPALSTCPQPTTASELKHTQTALIRQSSSTASVAPQKHPKHLARSPTPYLRASERAQIHPQNPPRRGQWPPTGGGGHATAHPCCTKNARTARAQQATASEPPPTTNRIVVVLRFSHCVVFDTAP